MRSIKEMDKRLDEREQEIERLNNIINELEKYLETEKDRLARETSNIYEDSLGKTRLVNENIYEEVQKEVDRLNNIPSNKKRAKQWNTRDKFMLPSYLEREVN